MFSTTRHVSLSTEPGFKYFSDGPLISARASVKIQISFLMQVSAFQSTFICADRTNTQIVCISSMFGILRKLICNNLKLKAEELTNNI